MLAVTQNDYGYLSAATLCCYPSAIDTVLIAAVAAAAAAATCLQQIELHPVSVGA